MISRREVSISPAFVRIFVEVLSNAVDNVSRSAGTDTPCTKIKVDIDPESGETRVWNDGAIIPIEKKDNGMYVHTMIFGRLRTSENYDDTLERNVSGRNGYGGKVSNVFSTTFCVEGVDPIAGKKLAQTWTDNMKKTAGPKVSSSAAKKGYTCVTFIPDFSNLGAKGYTEDIVALFTKYVIDAAMLTGISVYMNGEKLPISNLKNYAQLYLPEKTNEILHVKSANSEVVVMPNYETKEFIPIGFSNGIYNCKGGAHVDAWAQAVFRPLVDKFNKKGKPQINIKDVKQFFYLFVSSTVVNPEYESQSKHQLVAPVVPAKISPKNIAEIMKWSVAGNIEDIIHGKELLTLKKTEGKKRGYTKIDKLDSANKEGTKYSHECILIVCEGDSAKTYATTGIEIGAYGKKGRDWFGILPLRGVVLNTRNADVDKIAGNKELSDIIAALGLRYGVDYTEEENYQSLRYGMLMTLTDSDVDGAHILGLLVNSLQVLFPTLFERKTPFIVQMVTPIAKIPKLKLEFYNEREYNHYMLETGNKHKGKYYKGLGTSSRNEVKETFGKKLTEFIYDEHANSNLVKVFHKKYADDRKKWLAEYDPDAYKNFDNGPGTSSLSISDFLNYFMIEFSLADCARSIPNLMDGFKTTQRKNTVRMPAEKSKSRH